MSSSTSFPAIPTLVLDDREYLLGPGDCCGFKAGASVGHQLVNRSQSAVLYLEIGDRTLVLLAVSSADTLRTAKESCGGTASKRPACRSALSRRWPRYLMALIPATHKVDLGAVRHELKRELGLATETRAGRIRSKHITAACGQTDAAGGFCPVRTSMPVPAQMGKPGFGNA